MNRCKVIFGKFAFRRLNTEERRGPVNKALFETWSRIILRLDDEEIAKLVLNKKELFEKFTTLCDDYIFQNAIRAADKNSLKSRINKVDAIVKEILGFKEDNKDDK